MSELGRVGILISGRGSNMVSLVEGMREGAIRAEPAVVLIDQPNGGDEPALAGVEAPGGR